MTMFVLSRIIKSAPDESISKSLYVGDAYKHSCWWQILPEASEIGGICGIELPNKGKNQPIAAASPLKQGLKSSIL